MWECPETAGSRPAAVPHLEMKTIQDCGRRTEQEVGGGRVLHGHRQQPRQQRWLPFPHSSAVRFRSNSLIRK